MRRTCVSMPPTSPIGRTAQSACQRCATLARLPSVRAGRGGPTRRLAIHVFSPTAQLIAALGIRGDAVSAKRAAIYRDRKLKPWRCMAE